MTPAPPPMLESLPRHLEYTGEFGTELACFLPTIFWLHRAGHLRGRTVTSYAGMRPFYFFLDDAQFKEKPGPRHYVRAEFRPAYLANRDEHKSHPSPYEAWPDYRKHFGGRAPRFSKPLLIVSNKYSDEWKLGPINFLSCELLDEIFGKFGKSFQIVYLREGARPAPPTFSADHSPPLPFDDAAVLAAHPQVTLFDDLLRDRPGMGYNELKLQLFADARFFMTSQGGGCFFCALFGRSLIVVMHRAGRELRKAYRGGVFVRAAAPSPPLLYVARSTAEFQQVVRALPARPGGLFGLSRRPTAPPQLSTLLAAAQSDITHQISRPSEF